MNKESSIPRLIDSASGRSTRSLAKSGDDSGIGRRFSVLFKPRLFKPRLSSSVFWWRTVISYGHKLVNRPNH